jgi:hypothetical protein
VVPKPLGVLHRPRPFGHAFAQTIRRWYSATDASMRSEPTSELVAGSNAVAVWVDLCGSTPMTIMECGFPSLTWVGIRGGQSDFKYLSQQLAVTPLFSYAANADRRGDTPHQGQPAPRVTGITRVIPPVCYDTVWVAIPFTVP